MEKIKVVLDTTTSLRYKPLDQIDWLQLLDAKEIEFIVPSVISEELDEKKFNGNKKQSRRAKDTTKRLQGNWSGIMKAYTGDRHMLLRFRKNKPSKAP